MNADEALDRLEEARAGDDRFSYDILARLKSQFVSATPAERRVMNEIVRGWLRSGDARDRFDGAWLTEELLLVENLDIVRELRTAAETRDDPAAPYDWAKFDRIAARLISIRPDR